MEITGPRVVPKAKITVDGISAINPKHIDPYTAPTFKGFQNAFRAKYGKMPRAPEINRWDEAHPGEFEKRHPDTKGARRR